MDAVIKSLFATKKLKTRLLERHRGDVHVFFDRGCDTLIIQAVPPSKETVVHYLGDKNISLLYEAESKEIVGIQVEGFTRSFVPQHARVGEVWTKTISVKDFGDLVVAVEQRQPMIAKEVMQASRPAIEQMDSELASLLDRSFVGRETYVGFGQ
jgi:hypothetical protein